MKKRSTAKKNETKYSRMTWTVRLKIEALFNANHSYQSIASELGFAKSAIHYEVQHVYMTIWTVKRG